MEDSNSFIILLSLFLAIIGFFLQLFLSNQDVASLSLIFVGGLGMLLSIFKNMSDGMSKGKGVLVKVLTTGLPLIIFLGIIGWNIGLLASVSDKVSGGTMPAEYTSYQNFTTIMYLLQMLFLYNYVSTITNNGAINESKGKQFGSILMLLTLINFIMVGILNIIVKYYMTDG
mgnify:CR=1 FL=1